MAHGFASVDELVRWLDSIEEQCSQPPSGGSDDLVRWLDSIDEQRSRYDSIDEQRSEPPSEGPDELVRWLEAIDEHCSPLTPGGADVTMEPGGGGRPCTCKLPILSITDKCMYCRDRDTDNFPMAHGFASVDELARWLDALDSEYVPIPTTPPAAFLKVQPIERPRGIFPMTPPEAIERAGRVVKLSNLSLIHI